MLSCLKLIKISIALTGEGSKLGNKFVKFQGNEAHVLKNQESPIKTWIKKRQDCLPSSVNEASIFFFSGVIGRLSINCKVSLKKNKND